MESFISGLDKKRIIYHFSAFDVNKQLRNVGTSLKKNFKSETQV